jgi:hypothetical protein
MINSASSGRVRKIFYLRAIAAIPNKATNQNVPESHINQCKHIGKRLKYVAIFELVE